MITETGEEKVIYLVHEVEVNKIRPNPYQPRRDFDEEALAKLKASIEEYGILSPVLLRPLPSGDFELVAGERRLRAAKSLGLKTVPALFKEYDDENLSVVALIENLQREDLNVVEEALSYRSLVKKFGFTQEKLANRMGKSRPYITNLMRLLKLSPPVLQMLRSNKLSMGQAKPLLAIEDQDLELLLAEKIVEEELSAREAEKLVKRVLSQRKNVAKRTPDIYWQEAAEKLEATLGTKVRIVPGQKKSRIEIDFYGEDDLMRILESIRPSPTKTVIKHFAV